MVKRSIFSKLNARSVVVEDLGVLDYQKAHAYQLKCVSEPEDRLLFVEHPAIFTYGRRDRNPPSHAIAVERGGETTFHNPGQLVMYPILHLNDHERDLHWVLRSLEEVVILTLNELGVASGRRQGASGVWVERGEKKIASIGIAVKGWVTYHGIALNVDNDMSGFQTIHPCGFSGNVMVRLKDLLGTQCPSLPSLKERVLVHFASQFHRTIIKPRMVQ